MIDDSDGNGEKEFTVTALVTVSAGKEEEEEVEEKEATGALAVEAAITPFRFALITPAAIFYSTPHTTVG